MATKVRRAQRLQLPESLDIGDASELALRFMKKRGGPLNVTANKVEKISVPCLQVLLSARKTWAEDSHKLEVKHPSQCLIESLDHLGLSISDITTGTVAP